MSRKRSILRTQTVARHRRRSMVFKYILYVVFGLTIVAGIITLTRLDTFTLDTIAVHGNSVVSEKDVQTVVEQTISGNYFFVFPKHNKFLYPKSHIQKTLLASYPRIASVSLSVQKNILSIEVRERQPHALWCTGEVVHEGDCYFLDAVGYIFDHAPVFSGNAYLRFYGSIEGDPIGTHFDPVFSFSKTEDLLKSLALQNIVITDIVTGPHDYTLSTEDGRQLLINAGQDTLKTLDNLKIILAEMKKATTTWQSIDLRFGNKIYVKHSGEKTSD